MELLVAQTAREFDWSREVKDVLKPILDEISRMTARPREMDRLRREIAAAEDKLSAVKNAGKNVVSLINTVTDKKLEKALNDLEKRWSIHEQEIKTQLAISNEQLRQKLAEKKRFQRLFRSFFAFFSKTAD